jgi:hypothetical protein
VKKTLLLIAALSFAVRAEEHDADDPIGRMRSERALDDGVRTPEIQKQILDAAASEALRYGIGRSGRTTSAAVAGSAWVNIGPTTADFEYNGRYYFKVDSGRARKIIVDPTDANIVYFATSGGGVWKTRNALAAVTATSGPSWTPITESIVSLSIGSLAMNPGNHLSLVLGLGDPFDARTPGYNIVTSDDGGLTWSGSTALSGSYPLSGFIYTATTVKDLAFDPGGQTVLAATDAGLFRSTQGGVGANWTLIDVESTGHTPQDCWSIVYAGPGGTGTWVLSSIDGTSSGGKVWRSTDGGNTWSDVTSALGSESTDVGRITLTAAAQGTGQPWRVYALASNKARSDQKDVFRSDNAGSTWSSLSMHGCGTSACTGEAPTNPTDGSVPGQPDPHQVDLNFTHYQASYNHMLVADPANADIVFIGGNLAMGRSKNGGATWTVMTDWLPFGLTVSGSGGLDTNPNTLAQYAHADWHTAMVAHAGGKDYFYGGNDGGLIRGSNGTGSNFLSDSPGSVTWEDKLNRGIVTHLIYSVASGKERPSTSCTPGGGDIVYGGFQDNGTRLRTLPGNCTAGAIAPTCTNYVGYSQIRGGDGFGVGLGCTGPGAAMGSQLLRTYVDQIYISTNGGGSFTMVVDRTTGLSPAVAMDHDLNFKMKVIADLSDDATYLTPIVESTSISHVYRSTQNGALSTWNRINGTIHTAAGTTLAFWPKILRNVAAHMRSPSSISAKIYAAVSGGRVYVTTNSGTDWYESNRAVAGTGAAYLSLAAVAFDPNDATGGTVWAGSLAPTLSDGSPVPTGTGHLFKCTGVAGVAGGTCTAKSMGAAVDKVPVNVIKVDPGDSNTIYVGTEIGLYRSTDGGSNFTRYGTGLPLVNVTDIAINADSSAVRTSTFGRGFWEIYPNNSAPGVAGNGDLDNSGVIDGFDLVREAAIEFSDRTSPDFNAVGDLVFNNVINDADLTALVAKLGGFP